MDIGYPLVVESVIYYHWTRKKTLLIQIYFIVYRYWNR